MEKNSSAGHHTGRSQHGPVWMYLGLFLLYVGYTLWHYDEAMINDGPRYLRYANNLLQGAYADPADPEFLDGPGFPLILIPFVLAGGSLLAMQLLNSVFVVGAVWFFYRTMARYMSSRNATYCALALGLYPFTLYALIEICSDTMAIFLVCMFAHFFCRTIASGKTLSRDTLFAAVTAGWLALTKVIFGYVFLALLVFSPIFWFVFQRSVFQKVAVICLGAYMVCAPYLWYTYQLTGEPLYWATGGGSVLYYRAAPFENEFGNWFADRNVWNPNRTPNQGIFDLHELSENHIAFFKTLPYHSQDSATVTLERDKLFKARANEYISKYPEYYLMNTIASASRMFYNFPNSYTRESLKSLKYVLINQFIIVLSALLLFPMLWVWRQVPSELWVLILFTLIYLGGSILANGQIRYIYPSIPFFIFYIGYALTNVLSIKIKHQEQ